MQLQAPHPYGADANEGSHDEVAGGHPPQVSSESEEFLLKKKAYCLLTSLLAKRDQILNNLDLPKYEVPWLRVPASQTHH